MTSRTFRSSRFAAAAILTALTASGIIAATAGTALADTPTGGDAASTSLTSVLKTVVGPVSGSRLPKPVTSPTITPTPTPTPPPPVIVWQPPAEPVATHISQHSGSSSWSRTVRIAGTGFGNLSAVVINGVVQANLQVLSSTKATFTLGPNVTFQAQKNVPISLLASYDGSTQATPLTFTYVVRTPTDKQMQYAFQHWNDNSSKRFGYLAANDCADFVSQTLLARGWKQTALWFNDGPKSKVRSAAWWSSTAMSDWMHAHPNAATHLTYSQRAAAVVGDVVQFDWDGAKGIWEHTAVVSKVVVLPNGLHDIYYVAHTNNRQYGGSIMTLAADKKDYGHLRVQFWHLKH